MFSKRILILQQDDARFAAKNKEVCGMVKAVNTKETTVTVFITNANDVTFGEWWLVISFDGEVVARSLTFFSNQTFVLPLKSLQNVSCVLLKKENEIHLVAHASLGTKNFCAQLFRNAQLYLEEDTPYEKFVASTQNFYDGVDVQKLKADADVRYKSVEEYSAAFERYYAAGGNANYYQTVKTEIGKVFVQFPPYYPLIKKYQHSFFVRIDFPSSEKYFVLGVLQQNGVVRYICYGLPATSQQLHDKDFVLVQNTPTGFWMLFQDADTGQITTLPETV